MSSLREISIRMHFQISIMRLLNNSARQDARDAQRAAALFTKASEFYKKSGNFNKEDAVIQAEARFREEEEEERRVKEREEAFRAEQLLEADGMVARAKMLVEGEMLEDARQLLARAADAYRLSGLGEPAEAFLEVEGFLNFAEQERAHKEEEAKARREHFRRQGDAHLSKAREVLDSGSNDFDQARGYAKEAGGLYREGGWVKMEQQVLDTIQLISDREDVVVRQLMEADRLQREKKLEEQARKRELDALILQKQMQESAESAAAEAEARRRYCRHSRSSHSLSEDRSCLLPRVCFLRKFKPSCSMMLC